MLPASGSDSFCSILQELTLLLIRDMQFRSKYPWFKPPAPANVIAPPSTGPASIIPASTTSSIKRLQTQPALNGRGERVFDLAMAVPNGGFLSWLVHHEGVALGATLPTDEPQRPILTAFPFVVANPEGHFYTHACIESPTNIHKLNTFTRIHIHTCT